MEKTREELMNEMMENIKNQNNNLIMDEIALPGVDTRFTDKRVTKSSEKED